MDEPTITINGVRLHTGQAMTVRVALETFAIELRERGLGDDHHGTTMTQRYLAAVEDICSIMQGK